MKNGNHEQSINEIFGRIYDELKALQKRCLDVLDLKQLFDSIVRHVQGQSLSKEQHKRTSYYLKTTYRFLAIGEAGAARYELKMLRNLMKSDQNHL